MKYSISGIGGRETQVAVELESAQRIENLCAEINRACGPQASSGCLGILDSGNARHRLWSAALAPRHYTKQTISLEDLLRHQLAEKRDRLRLGVQLASAVIQLHATGWLNERWGRRDIHFFLDAELPRLAGSGGYQSVPVFEKPFLRRDFRKGLPDSQSQQNMPDLAQRSLVKYDASLFSLGIVLVELWFGECIEDFPEYPRATAHHEVSSNDNAEYQTADILLRKINQNEGLIYGNAVRRCIRGLDCTATSLEEDELKNKAHSHVVYELERYWTAYSFSI